MPARFRREPKSKCKAQRFVELSSLEPHAHNEGNSTASPERTLLKSPEASFRSCRGSLCLISTHSHSCSALKARQLVARLSRLGNFRWFVGAEAVCPYEHTPVPDLRLLWPRAACVSATPPAGCPVGNKPPSFSALGAPKGTNVPALVARALEPKWLRVTASTGNSAPLLSWARKP